MSVAAALAYRWDGRRSRLYFQTRPGSYNGESLVAFLKDLRRHFAGQPVLLLWDRLPGHRSRLMQDYLRTQRRWVRVEWLPPYAPELNPVENLWGNVKGQEMANFCPDHLSEAETALQSGMSRVRKSPQLCFAFLDRAGLSF